MASNARPGRPPHRATSGPPGHYQTSSKFQVYGKAVRAAGAGGWFTRFRAPAAQDNTDVGFRAETAPRARPSRTSRTRRPP